MMTLGQKIQEIRQARGFSQEAVAHDLGLSRTSYAKIERDETEVTIKRLEQIAQILKVNTWAFLSPESAITITGDIQDNKGGNNGIQHIYSDFTEERQAYHKHIENLEKQILQQQKIIEAFVKKMG